MQEPPARPDDPRFQTRGQIFNTLVMRLPAYLRTLEDAITRAEEDGRTKCIDRFNPDLGAGVGEQVADEVSEFYFKEFRRSSRYSFVVLIVTFLERIVEQICDDYGQRSGSRMEFRDFGSGDPVGRAKLHLRKVRCCDRELESSFWEPIQQITTIRHCIVHTEGKLLRAKKREALAQFPGRVPGFLIEDGSITLEREFCEWALKRIFEFLNEWSVLYDSPPLEKA